MEEVTMELVVCLPSNHPLGVVTVDTGRRIGVANTQWRNWMLQLTTFLLHQVRYTVYLYCNIMGLSGFIRIQQKTSGDKHYINVVALDIFFPQIWAHIDQGYRQISIYIKYLHVQWSLP